MNNIRIENVIHTELSQQMFASETALAQSTEVHKKQTINMKKKPSERSRHFSTGQVTFHNSHIIWIGPGQSFVKLEFESP